MKNRFEKSGMIHSFLYDSIGMDEVTIVARVKELRNHMSFQEMSQLVTETAESETIGLSEDSGGWYFGEVWISNAIASLQKEEALQSIHFMNTERLEEFCTDKWGNWGLERLINRADIDSFGILTDNHQWIHEDDERCSRESVYGEVIAHGFFLLTLLPALLPPEAFILTGYTHRIVRGGEWRFPAPVFAGDRVHVRSRLKQVGAALLDNRGVVLTRDIELWSLTGTKPAVTSSLQLQYF